MCVWERGRGCGNKTNVTLCQHLGVWFKILWHNSANLMKIIFIFSIAASIRFLLNKRFLSRKSVWASPITNPPIIGKMFNLSKQLSDVLTVGCYSGYVKDMEEGDRIFTEWCCSHQLVYQNSLHGIYVSNHMDSVMNKDTMYRLCRIFFFRGGMSFQRWNSWRRLWKLLLKSTDVVCVLGSREQWSYIHIQ